LLGTSDEGVGEGERTRVSLLPNPFVCDGEKKIVGMLSIEVFRHVIQGLGYRPL